MSLDTLAPVPPPNRPAFTSRKVDDGVELRLTGRWISRTALHAERAAADIMKAVQPARHVAIDLGGVERLDTAGAWVISRLASQAGQPGKAADLINLKPEHAALIQAAHFRTFDMPRVQTRSAFINLLSDVGFGVVNAGRDLVRGISCLGEVMACVLSFVRAPSRFRWPSFVFHMESFAFRSVPIIVLINFLVGGIVAQQGIFQLRRFGAATFAVDLIGILVLRELGVLLTAIMVAGRSGSAITAEIGSMKMREEIDALRVMGLDPVDVLIVPRVLALVASLTLLTFLADMAAVFGGMLVAWAYEGIGPLVYLSRLQVAIGLNSFLVGLIKAPFMALAIGIIASIEGLAVGGSAESLGRQVTDSVVKSIFIVIVLDGLFAMFFAAVNY